MIKLLLFLMLLPAIVSANTVDTWSGAGPYACHGNCSLEWAETQLTEQQFTELKEAQLNQPEPIYIPIEDGTVFTMMSYFKEGSPISYKTNTIAVLQTVEGSEGWVLDGWSFVKLDDCQNWAVVHHAYSTSLITMGSYTIPQPSGRTSTHSISAPHGSSIIVDTIPDDPFFMREEPPTDYPFKPKDMEPDNPISPVPLPLSFLMLLTAVLGMFVFNSRK